MMRGRGLSMPLSNSGRTAQSSHATACRAAQAATGLSRSQRRICPCGALRHPDWRTAYARRLVLPRLDAGLGRGVKRSLQDDSFYDARFCEIASMPDDTRQGAKPATWPDTEPEWPQVLAIARNDCSPAPRGLCMTRSSCPTRHPPTGGSNSAVRFRCSIKHCQEFDDRGHQMALSAT